MGLAALGMHSARRVEWIRLVGTDERLHRLVLARAIDRPLNRLEECDHISGDRLDNRRANL